MAVPKFNEIMPYVICSLSDGKIHTLKEVSEYCAREFDLSEKDRAEKISSGQNKFHNRVGWAKSYLKKAGLIESPKRGQFIITDEGMKAYQKGAECVTPEYLSQYDSFNEFQKTKARKNTGEGGKSPAADGADTELNINTESPLEQIDSALEELNAELSDELMAEIMKISPYEFESLVLKLLIKMGYGKMSENTSAVTKKSGDEGIDGVVSADKLGFDSIYIQAKQWTPQNAVGRPEIQKFLGALVGQGATKGIFITTSQFTKEAQMFASKHIQNKIVLIDGKRLTELMIEYDLGVSTAAVYKVKRIDSDFFSEDI